MELDGGFILNEGLIENAALNVPLLVEHFFLAVDAANHVDVPVVFQTLRTEALQVGQLEQRLVVGGCTGIRPLQMEGFLLPVLPEELLCLHGLNEALEQAVRAVEAQRGWSVTLRQLALFRRELVILAAAPLHI